MITVTAADIASRWRPLAPDEVERANTLAADALDLLLADPDLDLQAALDADQVTERTVRSVVAAMVKRAMTAPADGIASEGVGPFNRSFSNPQGDVYLRATERTQLMGRRRPSATTVRMGY